MRQRSSLSATQYSSACGMIEVGEHRVRAPAPRLFSARATCSV